MACTSHVLPFAFVLAMLAPAAAALEPYKVVFHLANLENGVSGDVVVDVHPDWSPLGAQRFAELLEQRFFDNNKFFHVVTGFTAKFGISGDAAANAKWHGKTIADDAHHADVSNTRGRLSFVTDGTDDRNTQIVFNIKDNDILDDRHYTPFAEVVEGMFVIDRIYNKYGGRQNAPSTSRLESEGNAFADNSFPLLSYIKSVETYDQRVWTDALADLSVTHASAKPLDTKTSAIIAPHIAAGIFFLFMASVFSTWYFNKGIGNMQV